MRYRWWPWAVGTVLAGALLMLAYLRLAGTTGMNSDAAGIVLQASGMLHGNVLLHGWWCTDVSFITTELPEYTLVTKLAGLRPEVVYICAALTYTLLVLLAAFVARGRARGPEGVIRALLAAGIMLAPQPTGNTTVLLGSPDHTGTAVPVLVLLLLLDRAPDPRARARWYIPAGLAVALMTAALLAWVMVGDPLVEVIAVVPLALACGVRAVRISAVRGVQAWRGHVPDGARGETQAGGVSPEADRAAGDRSAADMSWRSVGYHLLLGVAALAAIPLAHWGNSLILRHGGYQLGAARYHQLPLETVIKDAPFVGRSFLVVFGADYTGVLGAGNVAFALIHLIGVAVVVAAVGFAVWRLLVPVRRARAGDLVADFLVLAVVINVAAFLAFIVPGDIYVAHEIGPVAALGAALAGRLLSGPLLRVRVARRVHGRRPSATAGAGQPTERPPRAAELPGPGDPPESARRAQRSFPILVPAFAVVLAVYVTLLGIAASYPQGHPYNASLATWLVRHHLRSGMAGYWEASSTTVASNGRVSLLAIGIHGWNRRLAPDKWETNVTLRNPVTHSADFVVAGPTDTIPIKLALSQFGKPAATYHYGLYTIMVWHHNLLSKLNPI